MIGRVKHSIKQIVTLPARLAQLQDSLSRLGWRLDELEAKTRLNGVYALHQSAPADVRSAINRYELSVLSQNGEDGILFYLFSLLGTTNRYFVEFGIEDGRECNTGNLSLNFGWRGLLIEGSAEYAASAREYYAKHLGEQRDNVKVANAFVQPDNINQLFKDNGVPSEIDLLSIDIDGNDYWVWQAVNVTSPRVVVIEYNASMGAERSLSTQYDPMFDRWKYHDSGYYHGASLAALTKLGESKGYVLIGCDSLGINAFYVRKDVVESKLPTLTPQQAFFPHFQRFEPVEAQFARIQQLSFAQI
jgi:hypothetical protein